MEFNKIIQSRESVRSFADKKPSEEQIQYILEAGRMAPTAFNKQPQRVYVLESEDALQKMDHVHPCRYHAPIVLLVCADKDATSSYRGSSSYIMDGTIAATHMLLAATDVGLDSCWAGVSDVIETQKEFQLKENIYPICFIDLGYRAEQFNGSQPQKKRNSLETMVVRL